MRSQICEQIAYMCPQNNFQKNVQEEQKEKKRKRPQSLADSGDKTTLISETPISKQFSPNSFSCLFLEAW